MSRGNAKGGSFERLICRQLSLWWTNGERDDVFWRNRVKVTSKTPNAERQLGDISALHTIGLSFIETINVEMKCGYGKKKGKAAPSWGVLGLIDSNQEEHLLQKFWNQCITDANLSNRIPWLIFKRDFREPVICIRKRDLLRLFCGFDSYAVIEIYLSELYDGIGEVEIRKICLLNLGQFLEAVDPESVRNHHKLINKK